MNILLISLQKNLDTIGLKYLHYYLLKNGYNSNLLFLPNINLKNKKYFENIKKFILKMNPGFIGISLMSIEYYPAYFLTKYLKQAFPLVPIVWGGIHPTMSADNCFDYADYVCIGEGEKTILDMAKAVSADEKIKNINNLGYLENGCVKKNPLYPLIENLDEIPAYEQIPKNSFITAGENILTVNKKLFKTYSRYSGTMYLTMISRDCLFCCSYCSNNLWVSLYGQKRIRRRSVPHVMEELERALNDNPEIECINLQDTCFLVCSNEYLSDFCDNYRKKVNKPLIVSTVPNSVSADKLKLLKEAGLSWINFGLQSGSDRVNKEIYNRKMLKEDFFNAVKIVEDLNIAGFYDLILDNPFETDEDKLETAQTLTGTTKSFYPQFFSLTFFPGTQLYERAKKECPQKISDFLTKDTFLPDKSPVNKIIMLAPYLNKKYMEKVLNLYRHHPQSMRFKILLTVSRVITLLILEPITFFRLIKLSVGGSVKKTIRLLPIYFKEGITRYINHL